MHGRKKEYTTAEVAKAQQWQELQKIKQYQAIKGAYLEAKRVHGVSHQSTWETTAQYLLYNPDDYTAWHDRKRHLQHHLGRRDATESANDCTSEEKQMHQSYMEEDFKLTQKALMLHPKSYWIWHHRKWLLSTFCQDENTRWRHELALCVKCLALDHRNCINFLTRDVPLRLGSLNPLVHCWNHRTWVLAQSTTPLMTAGEDLAFTTEKLQQNFSNYSAWHHRSRLFMRGEDPDLLDLAAELDLAQSAVFTEPKDQSAWLYYTWLLFQQTVVPVATNLLQAQLALMEELIQEEPSAKCTNIYLLRNTRRDTDEHVDALLLSIQLMRHLDASTHRDSINKRCDTLQALDPYRVHYYTTLQL